MLENWVTTMAYDVQALIVDDLVIQGASGSLCHQIIHKHGIDDAGETGPCFPQGRISYICSISMLRNNWQCKYIFLHFLK